jgi:hypothetical protein
MRPESVFRHKRAYRLERIDDELLLFHPDQTIIIYCNPMASLIWQLCDGRHTVQEITALLTRAYPEAAKTIPAEIQNSLGQFLEYGSLDIVEAL